MKRVISWSWTRVTAPWWHNCMFSRSWIPCEGAIAIWGQLDNFMICFLFFKTDFSTVLKIFLELSKQLSKLCCAYLARLEIDQDVFILDVAVKNADFETVPGCRENLQSDCTREFFGKDLVLLRRFEQINHLAVSLHHHDVGVGSLKNLCYELEFLAFQSRILRVSNFTLRDLTHFAKNSSTGLYLKTISVPKGVYRRRSIIWLTWKRVWKRVISTG